MDQPVFWGVLTGLALIAMGVRFWLARPVLPQRARPLVGWEFAVAGASLLVLVFHCVAMFFTRWVEPVPVLSGAADAVNEFGLASQLSYWIPAVTLLIALRRVWLPAMIALVVTLFGVGYTMFVPHELWTHLWWIAASVVVIVVIAAGLIHRDKPATLAMRAGTAR